MPSVVSAPRRAPPALTLIGTRRREVGGRILDGAIVGFHDQCKIKIALGKTLTNQLAETEKGIRGAMTITVTTGVGTPATLRNEGIVEASGTLFVLDDPLTLDDIDGALWLADCKSTLRFERESLTLDGDIGDGESATDCGTIDCRRTVRTCGAWRRVHCGNVLVVESSGYTFEHAEYIDDGFGTCPNPGTGGGTSVDPFIVYADVETNTQRD